MGFIQLRSTNPKLGFIIHKNPSGLPCLRELRKGTIMGYYNKSDQYNIWFMDSDREPSFPASAEDKGMVDGARYVSPAMYSTCMWEMLRPKEGKQHADDQDQTFMHSLRFALLHVRNQKNTCLHQLFSQPAFTVDMDPPGAALCKMTVTTRRPLFELFHYCHVLLSCIALANRDHSFLCTASPETAIKLANSLNVVRMPYHVRYFVASRFCKSRKAFQAARPLLEAGPDGNEIQLQFGSTQDQRLAFVRQHLDATKTVVDIGCGDGFYALRLARPGSTYLAVDTDPRELAVLQRKAEKRSIINIRTFASVQSLLDSPERPEAGTHHVLMTEVLEHMPRAESLDLLRLVLERLRPAKIVITMPNGSFNVNYVSPGQKPNLRREDHFWEPTEQEFMEFVMEAVGPASAISVRCFPVGDRVGKESVSHGAVLA